jgi:hypothetical protein
MKLKTKIVALFAFIFIASYVPENYPKAFGDWKCKGSGKEISEKDYPKYIFENCNYFGFHHAKWHWGFRHYVWIGLGLTLTAISFYQIAESEKK